MFTPSGLSGEIFSGRYGFTEIELWIDACMRLAMQAILPETPEKQAIYKDKFFHYLSENYFVPGGRIWYNSGRIHPQLLNCFVLPVQDSIEGWGQLSSDVIQTAMRGGGSGGNFTDIRPNGASISNQRGTCPGPVAMMRMINGMCPEIKAGGQRRVALMFALETEHPDILDFLDSKIDRKELENANISPISRRTAEFIRAVKADGDWELQWKGRYKKAIKAREIWDRIVNNAWKCGEPGFLNLELALAESTIYYLMELICTNPCGEIVMSPYESCCLGHLVLPRFINDEGEVDWHLLGNVIRIAVRFLDNILSVNYYPTVAMKEKAQALRRIGLGTTGLADMLVRLGYRYGSPESLKFIDKLFRFISKAAYESSIMLAAEKGAFPLCDPKKHAESGFVKRLPKKIRALLLEYGIRNAAILTQAPTGTVSILSGNCSAGIEPIFSPAYWRWYWVGDERKRELVFHPLFVEFIKSGKPLDHFVSAHTLSPRDHFEVQVTVQRHIDNAVSKTINIPKDFPVEKMSEIWLEYLPKVKGTTFYREGSRGYIDKKTGKDMGPPLTPIPLDEAIALYQKEHGEVKTAAVVNDCPNGICEMPHVK